MNGDQDERDKVADGWLHYRPERLASDLPDRAHRRRRPISAEWACTGCGRPLTLEPGEEPCCGVGAVKRPASAAGAVWVDGGWCIPSCPKYPGTLAKR